MEEQTTKTGAAVNKTISTSEKGHAKNVANFQKLIINVSGFGALYNPSNDNLSIENMQNLYSLSDIAVKKVNHLIPPYSVAVAKRAIAYKPLNKLSTRLISAAKSMDIPLEIIENISTVKRKLDGRRAPGSKSSNQEEGDIKENKQISDSQVSYDNKLNNFNKYVEIFSNIPEFVPNEPELSIDSLNTYQAELTLKNKEAIDNAVPLVNARIERNKILYQKRTGLYYVAMDCKNYVKSVFGSTSPEYKMISKITFSRPKM